MDRHVPVHPLPEEIQKCRRDKSIPNRSAVDSGTPPGREAEVELTRERWPSIPCCEDANAEERSSVCLLAPCVCRPIPAAPGQEGAVPPHAAPTLSTPAANGKLRGRCLGAAVCGGPLPHLGAPGYNSIDFSGVTPNLYWCGKKIRLIFFKLNLLLVKDA
ncbi:hypothetical protein UY3_13989 [Chelonia mydas]|uniref:Uncharacterized protein n=1 Tax=Chelonia mydas TaxID=8469 RepID=M7AW54_CHEMY|nr:hypothetical protein UY3_13989 [Chelonia mydas]